MVCCYVNVQKVGQKALVLGSRAVLSGIGRSFV
jgi:hypothetical protein